MPFFELSQEVLQLGKYQPCLQMLPTIEQLILDTNVGKQLS
jgi:hypothetical protein